MTKTNLEIEEEWKNRSQYYIIPEEILKDITNFWLSKLQQRMDEIEGEVKEKLVKVDGVNPFERFEQIGNNQAIIAVLNIIKSVDKNNE